MTDPAGEPLDRTLGVFRARRVLEVCAAVILVVGGLAVLVVLSNHGFIDMTFPGSRILKRDFVFDEPNTVPKWVASSFALGCAAMTAIVARLSQHRRKWWAVLSFMFMIISVDKVATLHDGSLSILRSWLGLSRIGSSSIAIVLAALVAVVYLPFVLRLPARVRIWFTVAASVFFTGELVLDIAGGWYRRAAGASSLGYSAFTTLEGLFEVTGLALFAYAVAIKIEMSGLRITARQATDQ